MTRIKLIAASLAGTLTVLIITGAAAPRPKIILNFVQEHNTKTTNKLPAGTHSVAFAVAGGSLYCASVALTFSDGDKSSVFVDSPLPDKFQ